MNCGCTGSYALVCFSTAGFSESLQATAIRDHSSILMEIVFLWLCMQQKFFKFWICVFMIWTYLFEFKSVLSDRFCYTLVEYRHILATCTTWLKNDLSQLSLLPSLLRGWQILISNKTRNNVPDFVNNLHLQSVAQRRGKFKCCQLKIWACLIFPLYVMSKND